MSGASVAPTIEPVAKINAAFAPVSACAAARRTTLDRARASPDTSSTMVASIIRYFPPGCSHARRERLDSRHYGCGHPPDQPTQTGARYVSRSGKPLHTFPDHPFGRPNARIRLLAVIFDISISARPELAASLSNASISRTPHWALVPRRLESNTALLMAVCLPWRLNGP